MWCDNFDADLPKMVPGARDALGEYADLKLTTFAPLYDGAINHPSCWNTSTGGYIAFFWTSPENRPHPAWHTDDPENRCTLWEAVRDEWVHSADISVNGIIIWHPPARLMEQLMADTRGQTPLDETGRDRIRRAVCASLTVAASLLNGAGPT